MQKNKWIPLILLAAFVLLLAGAGILYKQLGDRFAPAQMLVQQPQDTPPATEPATTPTQPEPSGETIPEETTPATESVMFAPDFTVYDTSGNPVKLSDFFGMPFVLNFWASWCGPCQSEMPEFQEKFEQLDGQVQFLMINMTGGRETLSSATSFISTSGYTFPVYYDTASNAAMTYDVYYLPTTYFINAEGHLIARATSALSAEVLQMGIDMILPPEE